MRQLLDWLREIPRSIRWSIYGTLGLLLAVGIGASIWAWLDYRETEARRALVPIEGTAHQALGTGEETALRTVSEGLKQFLKDHPRSSAAAEAWYTLGNVEYRRGDLDAAAGAFAEAARRGHGSVAALGQLGVGYARERKGELPQALDAYDRALAGSDATSFLHGDLILAKARVQEELKDRAGAVESYKRFLRDVPASSRRDEVRARLAILGASS